MRKGLCFLMVAAAVVAVASYPAIAGRTEKHLICHRGRPLVVAGEAAFRAHIAHGDLLPVQPRDGGDPVCTVN